MTSLEDVRARFARKPGPAVRRRPDRGRASGTPSASTGGRYRDRVFGPVTTIWGFLSQVLSDDHSCRDAVARVVAHRAAGGLPACSPNTASYCNARGRLPDRGPAGPGPADRPASSRPAPRPGGSGAGGACSSPTGRTCPCRTPRPTRRPTRRCTTSSPGLGFPLARVAVLLSLATGACHDLAVAPYAGKGTGETTLLRQMYGSLRPGDVVLADAVFDNYFLASELRARGRRPGRPAEVRPGRQPGGPARARRGRPRLAAAARSRAG